MITSIDRKQDRLSTQISRSLVDICGCQPVSRTCGTESGIFYRSKSLVCLGLKLKQHNKIKKVIFSKALRANKTFKKVTAKADIT